MPRGKNPNSLKNLRPITENMSPEDLRKCQQEGRKKGTATIMRNREMRDIFKAVLDMNINPGDHEIFQNLAEADNLNITVNEAIALAQVHKAINGDTKAAEFVRDTAGQKPTEKKEINANINAETKLDQILKTLREDDDEEDEKEEEKEEK